MDKRGFTLIELLATVIIIAIIMTLILPSALRVSKKNSKRIYGEYENMMVEYAKVSLLNNQDVIDLIDLEELEKVKMECSGYVEIDHNTNPPQYSPYITCGDKYTTENYNRSYAKTIVPIPVCKNAIYNGNNQLLVESNEAYTITNGTRKDVGKQDVVLSLNDTNEYIWVDSTFENKTLNDCEIHKREIIVTADTKTMNYGESVPSNSYTIENAINGVNPLTSSVTYTYKDVNNNTVIVNSSTPVGIYNIVPNTSVSDNYSLILENGVLIIMRNVNTMTVTNNQSWSTTFANSVQEKTFTGATNAQGTVTYTILSQNKGTTSVNYFSISNNTINKIQMAAGTPAGNYSVVISVTAQGDANHLENTIEITLNITVGALQCDAPSNIQIGTDGKVSWTASSNCTGATYQVKVANGSYSNATNPVNKLSDITASTGSRSVCVKVVAPNNNYSNNEACVSKNVYSVTLTKGTGISSVTGAGNYITGATVTLGATPSAGYNWSKWTQTSGGAQVSTTNAYQTTITSNLAYTANTTAASYTLTYLDNIFAAQNQSTNGVAVSYTENGSYLTLNGTYSATSMNLWNIDRRTINSGDVFKITIKYISGSLICADKSDCTGSNGRPSFILDLTTDGTKFSDRTTSPNSCVGVNFPTSGQQENTITVASSRASANGLQFWIYQKNANNATFNNYKVQILITKVHSKSVTYNSNYGTLDTPSKQGFDFNGWYTDVTGGTQVTSATKYTNTSNQTVYARYTSHKLNLQYNGNGSDVTWCSTSSTYGMDSSKYAIIQSSSSRNTHTIAYGQFISYNSGLNNYNNTSYFCFSKSGYTAVPSSEWVLSTDSSKKYGQDVKTYTAIGIASDAGCNLASTSACIAQFNVNWKSANPISVTATQSWSPTFSTSNQDKSFTAATGGQGSVTYAIQSQKKGSTTVSSFSIPTNTTATLRMAASTGVGTYTVVIRATAAGNDNYIGGYKDITMTVTVGKASNPISVTSPQSWSPTFSTSNQDKSFTAATGGQGSVTYAIQSQKKGSTTVSAFTIPTNTSATLRMAASTGVGTYTVVIRATAAGNDNYNSGYKDITMTVTVGKASNPIAVTASQSWSEAFATSAKTKAITAATGAQGSVTYAIQSQPSGSYFTISGTTLTRKASTPAGSYSVVIRATAAGNDNYNSGYKDITMSVTVSKASNPISVTATQSWSPTFSTSNQDKSFTAATGGQGSVTYAIQSQKKGSTTVSAFSIPTNTAATLRMAASTGVGTYTVVIRATAAGNDNYNSGYKDITMTVTVGKANNPISVTSPQSWSEAFATSAKTKAITAATGAQGSVTYAIQSQPSGSYFTISGTTLTRKASTPAGSYSVVIRATAAGNDNYNSGYKDITMSVTVGRAGISFPTCTSVYYNGSSQTLFAAHTSGNYTNSAITGTNAGTYKGNLTPTANYQWSSGSNVTSARELSCVINASEALNTVNGVTTGYATLQAAFNASTTGTTKLLKDITSVITITDSYNKTIDFNNKKAGGLTNSGTVIIKNGKFEGYDSWIITNYATMTINDTSVNYTSVDTGCAIVNYKSGSTTPTMTLNNVTINSKSNSLDNDGGTMYATNVKITNDGSGVEVWNKHGGKITFTGGSVSAGNMCAHDNCAAYNNSLANSNDLLTIVNTTVGSTVKAFGKVIHIKTVTHNNLPFVMTGLLNYASSSDSLECPTWTTANGQDDIIWHGEEASVSPGLQAEQGGKYCYFARVNHNNETGTYSTHFYVNGKFVVGTSWTWN